MTTMLSDHFSLEEATFSPTASRHNIINTPSPVITEVIGRTAVKMEKVRWTLSNNSIQVNSWYRCIALNRLLLSKDSSQHTFGEAVDFLCPKFGSPLDICKRLMENKELIAYDQLILEHDWVHISFAILSGKPRSQVLSLLEDGSYSVGLTNKKGIPYV